MLLVVLSIVGTAAVVIGIPATILQARSAIRDGRQQQVAHDKQLRDDGFAEGVASLQAELHDWRNKAADLTSRLGEMTDDRNYWRGQRGAGTDHRFQGGGDGRD